MNTPLKHVSAKPPTLASVPPQSRLPHANAAATGSMDSNCEGAHGLERLSAVSLGP